MLTCLKGEPVFLREEDTAARYGISGTAIRQIFSRLAGSGIIEHVPRRGWRVRPFRAQQLDEFTQVRKVLELEAMRLAWPKLVDADLQEMRDGNVLPEGDNDAPKINDGIHRYLIEKAGNQYIADFMERHMPFFFCAFHLGRIRPPSRHRYRSLTLGHTRCTVGPRPTRRPQGPARTPRLRARAAKRRGALIVIEVLAHNGTYGLFDGNTILAW